MLINKGKLYIPKAYTGEILHIHRELEDVGASHNSAGRFALVFVVVVVFQDGLGLFSMIFL